MFHKPTVNIFYYLKSSIQSLLVANSAFYSCRTNSLLILLFTFSPLLLVASSLKVGHPAVIQSDSTISLNIQGGHIQDFSGNEAVASVFSLIINESEIPKDYKLDRVCLSINHKRTSDLKIELENPNGTSIWLSNRNGGFEGQHYANTCFSETGLAGYIHQATAPFDGEFIPDGRFNFLREGASTGEWNLRIYDLSKEIAGDLYYCTLFFTKYNNNEIFLPCNEANFEACQCPTQEDECLLLPDLVLLDQLTENTIRYYPQDHPKYPNQLRFATSIANVGDGPMEIEGMNTISERNGISYQKIKQSIYKVTKQGLQKTSFPTGEMYYDASPGHDHYHVDNWVEFKLIQKKKFLFWDIEKIICKGTKVSFCLFDSGACTNSANLCNCSGDEYKPSNLINYGMGKYTQCGDQIQGISVGGYDTYGADYEGQFLQLDESVQPGTYYLEITIDPDGRYQEKNKKNNTISFKIIL